MVSVMRNEKGIQFKSGAIPVAVSSTKSVLFPLPLFKKNGKAYKTRTSQKTCQ